MVGEGMDEASTSFVYALIFFVYMCVYVYVREKQRVGLALVLSV